MTTLTEGAEGVQSDADFIRSLLTALGLSQREAARRLGVEDRAMRYYCSGKLPVPPAVLIALRDLQTSPHYSPAPAVLPELQTAFDAVDGKPKPIDEFGLATTLSQALTPLGRELTRPEKRAALAMIGALRFMSRRMYGKPVWGMYWQPLSSFTDSQNNLHHDPDIAQIDDTIVLEWRRLARAARHPVLAARYADLAWETSKFRVANAKKTPEAPTPAHPDAADAALAIDAYLDAVERQLAHDVFDAGRYIARALDLSVTIRDEDGLQRSKAALVAARDMFEAADSRFPFWVFDEIAWEYRSDLRLSDAEKCAVIAALDRALSLRGNPADPARFDPHSAQDAADRLARWHSQRGDKAETARAVEAGGQAMEAAAGLAKGLTAIALLERQTTRYRRAGNKEAAGRLEQQIRERAAEAQGELQHFETKIDISKEELDAWADKVAGASLEDGLRGLVAAGLVRQSSAEARVKDQAEHAPLMSHISLSIMRSDGFTSAVIGSVEDDLEGRTIHQAGNEFGFTAPFLNMALRRLIEKHGLDLAGLMEWLAGSPFFPAPRLTLVREGLAAWFAEDYVKAVHVLVPQIEAVLREVLAALGGSVMLPDPDTGGFTAIGLGAILNDPTFREHVPKDLAFHLRVLFQDPRGINLRNEVAHGLAAPTLFDRGIANWVVHSLVMVGHIRVKLGPKPGASTEESP